MSTSTMDGGAAGPSTPQTLGMVLVAAALALALTIAAVATWRSAAPAATHADPALLRSDSRPDSAAAGPATSAPGAAEEQETVTVFLVANETETEALARARIAGRGGIDLPADELVLVAGVPQTRFILKDLRLQLGDANVHVIDLRLVLPTTATPESRSSRCGLDARDSAC